MRWGAVSVIRLVILQRRCEHPSLRRLPLRAFHADLRPQTDEELHRRHVTALEAADVELGRPAAPACRARRTGARISTPAEPPRPATGFPAAAAPGRPGSAA